MSRIVVCDTGPLLHLTEANALNLLQLAGEVIIPPVVAKEFEQNASDKKLPDWVQAKGLDESHSQKAAEWSKHIDVGEAEAIALTIQEQAEWLLSDDAQARQFAEAPGLEVHGSIGLLLWAVAMQYVTSHDKALNLLDALAGSSLWISDRVLRQARKAIDKFFL